MNHSEVLFDILIFLMAAVIVVPVFQRLRTSPILGYLTAGIIVGPYGLALIRDSDAAHTLAEFGVVFLLFMVGLELSMERLRSMSKYVFGLGGLQVSITACLIGGIAWFFGMSEEAAMIIGGGLALSSTAFVLQLLIERGERASPHGEASFAILLFQDLAIVPLLILVSSLGEANGSFITSLGLAIAKAAGALILVVGLGRHILRPVYRVVAETRNSELFVATTLLVILGTGWLMSLVGISMVLGAFLVGVLLAETEYKHQVEADIRPFRGLLLGLFFISVGMSINISLIQEEIGKIALIVVALMAGKSLVTAIICRGFGLSISISARVGMLLSQGGEFGFVLFFAASTLGLLPVDTMQMLLVCIAITMIATPAMANLAGRFSEFWKKREDSPMEEAEKIREERSDHVIIGGFGRVGQTVAKILSAGGVPYIALDLDIPRITQCRAKEIPVFYGDVSQADTLRAAGADRARCAIITIDQHSTAEHIVKALRELFPNLPIYSRAQDLLHGRDLEAQGSTQAVPETLEASLQLGAIALTSLGKNSDEVISIVENLRKDDYTNLSDIIRSDASSQ